LQLENIPLLPPALVTARTAAMPHLIVALRRAPPALLAGIAALVLTACANTPRPPPPQPRSAAPAAQEPAEQAPRATSEARPYAPPSENAAEVSIEEIPLDAAGEPLLSPAASEAAARDGESGAAARAAGGGGGATPGSAATRAGAPVATGATAAPTSAGTSLSGPEMRIGSGVPQGERDGRGSRRAPLEVRGAGGAGARGSGLGQTPDSSGETGGSPRPAGVGAGSDAPERRDDDIVARQLREAAEREPDAELREKLWREYRRYVGDS